MFPSDISCSPIPTQFVVLQRRFAEESSGLKRKISQAQELLDQMTENEDPDTVSAIERCGPADRSPCHSPAEQAWQDMPAVYHIRWQHLACPHRLHLRAHCVND